MYNVEMIINPLYVAYVLIAVCLLLIGWIIRLEIKLGKFLRGSNAKSLENTIVDAHKKLDMLGEFRKDSLAYFGDVEKRLRRSVQAVETVRFNPFKGSGEGGNQSFSTAFIDEEGNGVVISSLYSRERVSVFSKPLKKFQSTFELTEEESEVLGQSKKNIS